MVDKDAHAACARILDTLASHVVGERALFEKLLAGALANGHVLFEDHPGLGKTTLVKVFARAVGTRASRVQFTPDLLPADIVGTKVWNPESRAFELAPGPVFTNVLLADEINRAPPKTQSALLEAMEEGQVTIEGETLRLPAPFFVLATQNPIEQEGTYPLPEAQMDRFMLRLSAGYPGSLDAEVEIMRRRLAWKKEDPSADVAAAVGPDGFRELQESVERGVYVHPVILEYIGRIVRAVRAHPHVLAGPSPRGALALLRASRSIALVRGRDFVTPDDVKGLATAALAHRVLLDVERVIEGGDRESLIADVLKRVEAPTRFGSRTAPAPQKGGA